MSISFDDPDRYAPGFLEAVEAYERDAEEPPQFELVLYVAGTAPRSLRAIANTRRLCQQMEGAYDLEIVDIYQQPDLAEVDEILAVPVLIKKQPLPAMRFVGDLSDLRRVAAGLGLPDGRMDGEGA